MFYIVTAIDYGLYYVSRFVKNKRISLILETIQTIVRVANNYVHDVKELSLYSIFCIIRNMVCAYFTNKSIKQRSVIFTVLLLIMTIMLLSAFNGLSTIFVIITGLVNLIGCCFGNTLFLRYCNVVACLCYTVSLYLTNNPVAVFFELVNVVVLIIACIKLKKSSNGDMLHVDS